MRIALGEPRYQFRLDHYPAPAWQAEDATACRPNLPNCRRGVNWGLGLSLSELKRFEGWRGEGTVSAAAANQAPNRPKPAACTKPWRRGKIAAASPLMEEFNADGTHQTCAGPARVGRLGGRSASPGQL